mmetsp:Transcript_17166/g.34808  ORF Transcript_17166/g.34808 Transcript_17166/m.34808 type:complete len:82 (+) Transcript_17166:228-473(+)
MSSRIQQRSSYDQEAVLFSFPDPYMHASTVPCFCVLTSARKNERAKMQSRARVISCRLMSSLFGWMKLLNRRVSQEDIILV